MFGSNGETILESGVNADTNDVISVELDADAWTVSFRKNDSEEIGTVEDIKPGEYCLPLRYVAYFVGDSASFV